MNYRDFVSDVRLHGHIDSTERAERAVRATLETLGEFGASIPTASSGLPLEIGVYLQGPNQGVGGIGVPEKTASASRSRGAPSIHDLRPELTRGDDSPEQQANQHDVARSMSSQDEEESQPAFEATAECFVERVKMREGDDITRTEAEQHIRAVFRALALALDRNEVHKIEGDVPEVREFWPDSAYRS